MLENDVTEKVIGCGIKVHIELGPGLLEAAYESCSHFELLHSGLYVERQKPIPLVYEAVKMDCGYRADLVVERSVIVEVKSVEVLSEIHVMQTVTHLKLGNYKLGLLINFNVVDLKTEYGESQIDSMDRCMNFNDGVGKGEVFSII